MMLIIRSVISTISDHLEEAFVSHHFLNQTLYFFSIRLSASDMIK